MTLPITRISESTGTTYYVATTGDDTRTAVQAQSIGTPWKTLTKALATVGNGATIQMAAGTYQPTVGATTTFNASGRRFSPTNPVTVVAAGGLGSVVIGPTSSLNSRVYALWLVNCAGIRFRHLVFNPRGIGGALGNYGSYGAVLEYSEDIEFDQCWWKEHGGMMFALKGGPSAGLQCKRITLYRSQFGVAGSPTGQCGALDETDTYFSSKGSHYIYAGMPGYNRATFPGDTILNGHDGFQIVNCLIWGTTMGRHIQLGPQARNTYIINNTFYGLKPGTGQVGGNAAHNKRYGGTFIEFNQEFSDTYSATGPTIIENNIFMNCDGHAVWSGSVFTNQPSNTVQKNIGWQVLRTNNHGSDCGLTFHTVADGGATIYSIGSGNFVVDPQLTDVATLDFLPVTASPAWAQGSPTYAPTEDFYGNARPATPSIGAIEGAPPGADPPPVITVDDFPATGIIDSFTQADGALASGWTSPA